MATDMPSGLPQLPPEIISKILVATLEKPPACAFRLFVPEWDLCPKKDPGLQRRLESLLRTVRFDTYTVLENGNVTVSTKFEHGRDDCICLPQLEDPRLRPSLVPLLDSELLKAWSGTSLIECRQRRDVVHSLMRQMFQSEHYNGKMQLSDPTTLAMLPSFASQSTTAGCHPAKQGSGTEPGRQHFYQRVRHVMVSMLTEDDLMVENPAAARRPTFGEVESVFDQWVDECRNYLLLDWLRMERLETAFVDLRNYSRGSYSCDEVQRMGKSLEGMGLKLLVLGGLRSYQAYRGAEPLEEAEEEWDGTVAQPSNQSDAELLSSFPILTESTDSINRQLVCLFIRALRPGGKLVLVDKQVDAPPTIPISQPADTEEPEPRQVWSYERFALAL